MRGNWIVIYVQLVDSYPYNLSYPLEKVVQNQFLTLPKVISNITLALEDIQVSSNSLSKYAIGKRISQTFCPCKPGQFPSNHKHTLPYLDNYLRSGGKVNKEK